MSDLSGSRPDVVEAIKEIHDGVYKEGMRNGVDSFLNYLFSNCNVIDEYDVAAIKYYADRWKEEHR